MDKRAPSALTEATSKSYLHRATLLMARVKAEGFDEAISWLSSLTNLRPASFRQYRACLVHYHEANGYPAEFVAALRAVVRSPSDGPLPLRTSAFRIRGMPPKKVQKLFAELATRRSETARHLELWLRVAVITGHRPCEWRKSGRDTQGGVLRIYNAKATKGRSHGIDRFLELALTVDDEGFLSAWEVVVEQQALNWDAFLHRCQVELRRATLKAFGPKAKTITLYSPRHQFASDIKKSGATKVEVAAAMGHASIETAGLHYGKKKDGRVGASRAKPSQRDVQRVKDLNPAATPAPAEAPVAIKPSKPEGPSFG